MRSVMRVSCSRSSRKGIDSLRTAGNCGCCPCATSRSFNVWYAGLSASPSGRSMRAAAFGARVARGESRFGEVTRPRCVERGFRAFYFERLRAQREIRTAVLRAHTHR